MYLEAVLKKLVRQGFAYKKRFSYSWKLIIAIIRLLECPAIHSSKFATKKMVWETLSELCAPSVLF